MDGVRRSCSRWGWWERWDVLPYVVWRGYGRFYYVTGTEVGTCGKWIVLILVRKKSKGNTQGRLKRRFDYLSVSNKFNYGINILILDS